MKASEIRSKYLRFFADRGHAIIPASPIIPSNDPTTLFTSSGMQQIMPYLKGEPHPMGTRLVDSQPCFRAEDIEEIGDNRHTTMFEMLGNWSLGDYFKQDQLTWVWQFFTQELRLDPQKLHVTLFAGNKTVPKDEASYQIWLNLGVKPDHIHYYPAKKNWWSRAGEPQNMPIGEIGGPDSEIFYDFGEEYHFHENSILAKQECHVNCDCGRFLEIGNSVFMQYQQTKQGMQPLPAKNVDFGGGFERLVAVVQNKPDIFQTDLFLPLINSIETVTHKSYQAQYQAPMRVIADHLRAVTFMAAQGLTPSNKLQGYIMRRLIRRAVVKARSLGGDIKTIFLTSIPTIIQFYAEAGFIEANTLSLVEQVISQEIDKFSKVLDKGYRLVNKLKPETITEQLAFDLYQSMGFPFEITQELVALHHITLDKTKFDSLLKAHQQASRTASTGMFKGGLANHTQTTTQYHTATHLLHQALIDVLGSEVTQAGSNINDQRLRFDYTYSQTPTSEQLQRVVSLINSKIKANLTVFKSILPKQKALDSGAKAFFIEKYPAQVSVYTIGHDENKDWYSKELCGGPHVQSTQDIPLLRLIKEKNLGAGKRRIYLSFV